MGLPSSEWNSQILNDGSATTSLVLGSNNKNSILYVKASDHVDGKQENDTNRTICRDLMNSGCTSKWMNTIFITGEDLNIPKPIQEEKILAFDSGTGSALMSKSGETLSCKEAHDTNPRNESSVIATFCHKVDKQSTAACIHDCGALMIKSVEDQRNQMEIKHCDFINSGTSREEKKNFDLPEEPGKNDQVQSKDFELQKILSIRNVEGEQSRKVKNHGKFPLDKPLSAQEPPTKSFVNLKAAQKIVLPSQSRVLELKSTRVSHQCNVSQKVMPMREKIKPSHKSNMHNKENISVAEVLST